MENVTLTLPANFSPAKLDELKNKDNILDSLAEAVFTVDKEFKVTLTNLIGDVLLKKRQ